MTVQALPWAIQGQSHPAEVARNALAALFGVPVAAHTAAASVTTAGGGHGVVGAGDLAVAQNGTPNMSVNVAAGRAVVRSGESASILAGVWTFLNDATVNLSISAADPTNGRRDLVIAEIRDANYSGASNDARLAVVTGTPSGSPADPAVPANALVLARVTVGAAVSSITNANITDLRTRAWTIGGPAVVAAAAGLPSGASLHDGLLAYITGSSRPSGSGVWVPDSTSVPAAPGLYTYDGRWNPPWNMPWGVAGFDFGPGTDQTGVTTVTDVTGCTVTFTAAANRLYRVSGRITVTQQSSPGQVLAALNVGGSDVAYCLDDRLDSGVRRQGSGFHVFSPAAGSVTCKLRLSTSAGSVDVKGTVSPALVLVEDMGPYGAPA